MTAATTQIGQWVLLLSMPVNQQRRLRKSAPKAKQRCAISLRLVSLLKIPSAQSLRDLLRELTKQNFGFEGIKGSDAQRQKALKAWKDWAESAGI